MIRTVLSLEKLSFMESEGKVGYRYGQDAASLETMDYLELTNNASKMLMRSVDFNIYDVYP